MKLRKEGVKDGEMVLGGVIGQEVLWHLKWVVGLGVVDSFSIPSFHTIARLSTDQPQPLSTPVSLPCCSC